MTCDAGHDDIDPTCRHCLRLDIAMLPFHTTAEVAVVSARIAAVTGRPPRVVPPFAAADRHPGQAAGLSGMTAIVAAKNIGRCVHLGVVIPNKVSGSCRTTHECERGHGNVRPCVECRTCEDFSADDGPPGV